MNSILSNLISDEFSAEVGFELPTSAMRRVLRQTEEFEKVQFGLRNDMIGRVEIQEFVDALMDDFQPGRHFGHTPALMLLAVALEQDRRDFAEAYLRRLADLEVAGLYSASRMAEFCLSRRGEPVSNTFQEAGFVPTGEPESTESEWYESGSGTYEEPEEEWIVD